jgi:hypothetical protein
MSISSKNKSVRIFCTCFGFTAKQTVGAFQPIGALCQKPT